MTELQVASLRDTGLPDVLRIPVVVHIVASDERYEVSDQQVHEQIARLNEDYRAANADHANVPDCFKPFVADTRIEFALATRDPAGQATSGILRKKTTIEQFPHAPVPPDKYVEDVICGELMLGETGSLAWPRESYLNIWTCNMTDTGLLGFAAFPGSDAWRDGVVIQYTAFGASGTALPPYNMGRSATHEVGHWLNLLHIWGDDNGGCERSDNVADTPNQADHNYDKPAFPQISCDNGPNGAMFMNYMDYVDDDWMVMFTLGQAARMQATIQGPRASLFKSRGLDQVVPELEGLTLRGVIGQIALNRPAEPHELIFDGVDWVSQ